jgi:hypothetical protein
MMCEHEDSQDVEPSGADIEAHLKAREADSSRIEARMKRAAADTFHGDEIEAKKVKYSDTETEENTAGGTGAGGGGHEDEHMDASGVGGEEDDMEQVSEEGDDDQGPKIQERVVKVEAREDGGGRKIEAKAGTNYESEAGHKPVVVKSVSEAKRKDRETNVEEVDDVEEGAAEGGCEARRTQDGLTAAAGGGQVVEEKQQTGVQAGESKRGREAVNGFEELDDRHTAKRLLASQSPLVAERGCKDEIRSGETGAVSRSRESNRQMEQDGTESADGGGIRGEKEAGGSRRSARGPEASRGARSKRAEASPTGKL